MLPHQSINPLIHQSQVLRFGQNFRSGRVVLFWCDLIGLIFPQEIIEPGLFITGNRKPGRLDRFEIRRRRDRHRLLPGGLLFGGLGLHLGFCGRRLGRRLDRLGFHLA